MGTQAHMTPLFGCCVSIDPRTTAISVTQNTPEGLSVVHVGHQSYSYAVACTRQTHLHKCSWIRRIRVAHCVCIGSKCYFGRTLNYKSFSSFVLNHLELQVLTVLRDYYLHDELPISLDARHVANNQSIRPVLAIGRSTAPPITTISTTRRILGHFRILSFGRPPNIIL